MTNSDKGRKVRCVYMYRDDLIYGPVVTCANVDAEHNTITLTDEDGKLIYDQIWTIDSIGDGDGNFLPVLAAYVIAEDGRGELFEEMFCWGTKSYDKLYRIMEIKWYNSYLCGDKNVRQRYWFSEDDCVFDYKSRWKEEAHREYNAAADLADHEDDSVEWIWAMAHLYSGEEIHILYLKILSLLFQEERDFANADIWFGLPSTEGYRLPEETHVVERMLKEMNDKNRNRSSITKDEWSEQQKEARGNDGFISSWLSWVSKRMLHLNEGDLVEQKTNTEIKDRGINRTEMYHEKVMPSEEGYPCVGFSMEDAEKAYEHMDKELVKDYGYICGKNILHTWDDGHRALLRCKNCGGYILFQFSEFHGMDDDCYYVDYFPVTGPKEAQEINEKYNGENVEEEFRQRWMIDDGRPQWNR